LSQPGHPNVVRLLGAVEERLTRCVILEYCDGGDLQQALQRPTPRRFFFRVASGVATGLTFLHANGVMHRDLKSPNVLLHGEHGVKIADFGLAADRALPATVRTSTPLVPDPAPAGSYRWMAPEIVMHEAYSKSADVFSYAMILFELITHTIPFSDRSALQAAVSIGLQGKRPRLPAGTPTLLRDLVESCWAEDIASRPRALHL
ncbi:hypothetical protein EMIHUDRAFT_54516, partial [Emiliania huxleyi CCMP1516]|uniref:Protein kinase domain-containing protein n=2 Tax=Emiliania huxleyi TaxID=2903 RepID=A0A0D3JE10_EMIH1